MKFSLSKLLTLISILALVSSCSADREITISGKEALAYVQTQVDFGHRISGSKEIKACADWLKKEIQSFGVPVEIISWEEQVYGKSVTFYNVKATLLGNSEPLIIVGSHYDLKDLPNFEGANDSASSTAVLLEMIRVLKNAKRDLPTIEFYFFDGEECVKEYNDNDGLHGSKYAASKLKASDYQLMLLLDMIGDQNLHVTLSLDTSDRLVNLALKSAEKIDFKGKIGVDPDLLILDDHVPFRDLGIPSINLIDFDFGAENKHWHTVEDSMDKISVQSLQEVGDLALEMILQQVKQGKAHGQ